MQFGMLNTGGYPGGLLCDQCSDRFYDGEGPAWYPKNVDRAESLFCTWLAKASDPRIRGASSVVAREVAECVARVTLPAVPKPSPEQRQGVKSKRRCAQLSRTAHPDASCVARC